MGLEKETYVYFNLVFWMFWWLFLPMKMSDFPSHVRPRERAWKEGVSHLSDAELVAIVLRSGRKGKNVMELSQRILADAEGNLEILWHHDLPGLTKKGLGKVQSITLQAALELGHRLHNENGDLVHLDDGLRHVHQKIAFLGHEEFFVICLDLRNKCIGNPANVSRGSRYTVLVDPKDVLSIAVQRKAARIVVVHNHPSGSLHPSPQDVLLTKQILEGCQWLDIELVDHVIVAQNESLSLREKGLLS